MSKGIIQTVAGGLEIAAGVALAVATGGASAQLSAMLIIGGAGMLISGIGTMLHKGPLSGIGTTTRNPVAPWEIPYGRVRIGGTIVYLAEFGDSNKWLDMVIVAAACHCESVDELLFDNQRVQIGANNTSFTPVQQNLDINSPTDITRVGNVVTIKNVQDIPLLSDGDRLLMEGIHPVNLGLNGIFPVFDVLHNFPTSGKVQFSYLCGGSAIPPATIDESGRVHTQWQDYKKNVYLESIGDSGPYNRLGHAQTLGETFVGMTAGTPKQGDTGTLVQNDANGNNPWTRFCSLVGMTAVFIRLEFDSQIFSGGIPQISFHVKGKNDIQDPRSSPPSRGYTENSALCIADYLSNTTWGFKAAYGTEIDTPQLIAAANICDERVGLAFPLTSPLTTEPRYTCNGHFNVAMRRGEVLQNMLTSCAGRITYIGGKFGIWPAAWTGSSLTLSDAWVRTNAAGGIRWRSSVSISNLYNGVKGTYVSPVNNWQSSDFPRYAQDADHGYNDGPPEDEYDQNLANDGGDRRWLDIQLPFTISCPTAQRLAKIELMRRRQQGTGTFVLNMAGYQIAPLDVISMSLAYFGWTGKYLEVLATRFKIDRQTSGEGEVTLIGTEIDVQETDPSVYDWELIEELSPQGYQHPGVPDSVLTPDPPTNLKIVFDDAGNTVLTWTAPLDAYVVTIEGRYQLIQSPEGIWISLGAFDVSVTQTLLPNLLPGAQYIVQLRSVNGAGIPSVWVSASYTPISLPAQWAPYSVKATEGEALYPGESSFRASVSYTDIVGGQAVMADGTTFPRIGVIGVEPVNLVIEDCPAPIITAARVNATGGQLPGGVIVYVTVTADRNPGIWDEASRTWDASTTTWDTPRVRNYTLPAAIFPVEIPAGPDTNSIDLDITWPSFAGLTGYDVYAALKVDLITGQGYHSALIPAGDSYTPGTVTLGITTSSTTRSDILTASGLSDTDLEVPDVWSFLWQEVTGGTITGAQLTQAFPPIGDTGTGALITLDQFLTGLFPALRTTWSPPNPNLRKLRVKAALGYHLGVVGASIDSISGNSIVAAGTIDTTLADDWDGRVLLIIGRPNSGGSKDEIPFWSRGITSFDPATGTFVVDGPSIISSPPVNSDPRAGDVFVVCTLGYDNSANPFEVTDTGLVNSKNFDLASSTSTPFSGLTPNLEQGMVLRVIAGKSRGAKSNVLANTKDTYFLDSAILLDSSSVWIITERGWPYVQDSAVLDNPDPFQPMSIQLPLDNFDHQSFVVGVFLVDLDAAESDETDAPMRMTFLEGDPGALGAASEVQISFSS